MKKKLFCLTLIVLLAFPSIVVANILSNELTLVGREIFPGIKIGGLTRGAVFIGKVLDASSNEAGYFSVTIDHNGVGIEVCNEQTTIVSFKLILSLTEFGRLVLVMNLPTAKANWFWDDPNCPDGGFCWDDNLPIVAEDLVPCTEGNSSVSLIAAVPAFILRKQWIGTYGSAFRPINFGTLKGLLIHTPPVFPAVIGRVNLFSTKPSMP